MKKILSLPVLIIGFTAQLYVMSSPLVEIKKTDIEMAILKCCPDGLPEKGSGEKINVDVYRNGKNFVFIYHLIKKPVVCLYDHDSMAGNVIEPHDVQIIQPGKFVKIKSHIYKFYFRKKIIVLD